MKLGSRLLGILLVVIIMTPFIVFSAPTAPVYDVFNYGAVGNGTTKDTAAIQAAIDACSGSGGSVYLHNGTFLTGMIVLKSNMTFYIDSSATLLGSTDDADYPDKTLTPIISTLIGSYGRRSIYSEGANNLKITGGGTVDGHGDVAKWLINGNEQIRPVLIYLTMGNTIEVSNLHLTRSAMWTLVPLECDYVTIRDLDINCNLYGNRDGIDPCDCHHLLIENCTIFTDDDAICFKSGHSRGVDDVSVRNCTINKSERASGIKFGTTSYGGFKNMLFEDITIKDVDKGGLSFEAVDGADIYNVTARRIKIEDAGTPIFIILGDRGRTPTGDPHKIGSVDTVKFEDITASNLKYATGCAISGSIINSVTYKINNLTFDNVDIIL